MSFLEWKFGNAGEPGMLWTYSYIHRRTRDIHMLPWWVIGKWLALPTSSVGRYHWWNLCLSRKQQTSVFSVQTCDFFRRSRVQILQFIVNQLPFLAQPVVKYEVEITLLKKKTQASFLRNYRQVSIRWLLEPFVQPTLNLSALNIVTDILWTSSINLAANTESSPQNFLHCALQLLRERLKFHRPGNLDDFIKGNWLAVLNILLFLSVTRRFLQSLDDQRWRRGNDGYGGLAVLDGEFYCNTQTFLITRKSQELRFD